MEPYHNLWKAMKLLSHPSPHIKMEIKMYDTVSLPYVIGRIDDVLEKFEPEDHEHGMGDAWYMHEELQELRRELIYNMGVNSLNRQKEAGT